MEKVICPQCEGFSDRPELDHKKALIENGDFTCPSCGFTTWAWQFDVVVEEPEEPKTKTIVGVLHPCGG